MVETLISKLRAFLFKGEYAAVARQQRALDVREKNIQNEVNQRVAVVLSRMDPYEMVMREFDGVFGESFERPEERLDQRSVHNLQQMGYTIADDPSFLYLCSWIMNSQANETFLRSSVPDEKTAMMKLMYGRAQVGGILAFRKEIRRLSEAYKDRLNGNQPEEFDSALSTE